MAKTNSMLFCTKSKRKILNSNDGKLILLIHDRDLESIDIIKYLGVHVDYNLSWKDHLKSVASKVCEKDETRVDLYYSFTMR